MSARMRPGPLPPNPGASGWVEVLPPAPPPTPVDRDETADWLVIGAGIAGLTAARRLAECAPGARIVVVDAVRVGEGPAGRNSGFMIDLPHDLTSDDYGGAADHDRAVIARNRAAIAYAAEAAAALEMPPSTFARIGKINGAATEKGLARNAGFAAHLARLGEDYEMMDAAEMKALTGTDYYRGGLYTPGAAILQPAAYTRALAVGLRSNRVTLREASPITALTREGGLWRAETPGGAVTAPRAILAVNGLAERFGFFAGRFVHTFTWASMTRALTAAETAALGGAPDWALTPADPMGTTVRRVSGPGGDRIVIRNRFTYEPTMEAPERRLAAVARYHDRAFAARFPMLAGVAMAHRWGGRLCISLNDAPAWGEVAEGLFSACCQNGLGLARGTFAGVAAADAAMGAYTEFSRAYAAADTPAKRPPYVNRLTAGARLRWGEWRAGAEL